MPRPRVAMRRIGEVLRLKYELGLSDSESARGARLARSTFGSISTALGRRHHSEENQQVDAVRFSRYHRFARPDDALMGIDIAVRQQRPGEERMPKKIRRVVTGIWSGSI